jgi:phospholipid/cholesterol/gamma-HCH transport system permease protein
MNAEPLAPAAPIPPALELRRVGPHGLELRLTGGWTAGARIPSPEAVLSQLGAPPAPRALSFDCQALADWDSILLTFLLKILGACEERGLEADRGGLPAGVRGMLELARAVPERQDTQRPLAEAGFLAGLGRSALSGWADAGKLLEFLGEAALAASRLARGRSCFRGSDLVALLVECGPRAVPIVSLISFLVGMILAFVGAVQLKMFGAQIFIADLVGLGMAREMGAMMTAIIMAGRTGAAYAAQLGSMQANDEIDALLTTGFPPMEFLVLPRILALMLALPLLCLYSDFMGILGGALVASSLFDVSYPEYLNQLTNRLVIGDFMTGISKSVVFGVLVAVAGCLRGLQCGRNSTEVGLATTSAVVTGIVFIVVADAIMPLVITALKLKL